MSIKIFFEIFMVVWEIYKYLSDNKVDPKVYLENTREAFQKLKEAKDAKDKFDAIDRISSLLNKL
jgi:hypothetical protein